MNTTWATRQSFFDKVDSEFHFELDVCALPETTKCARYFTPEDDGLSQEWKGMVWMNPPYGCANLEKWLRKAIDSASRGATVVALVPTRTNPPWWHQYVMKAHEIRFIVKKGNYIHDSLFYHTGRNDRQNDTASTRNGTPYPARSSMK